MKLIWCTLTFLASTEGVSREYHPWRRTQLTAVTRFPGIEEFYLSEIRGQSSRSLQAEREYPNVTADTKAILCKKVLNSHSRTLTEFHLNLDLRHIRHELKRTDRNVYEQLYRHVTNGGAGCFGCASSMRRFYVNPYLGIDAFVGENFVQENAFKCLARSKEDRHLVQYYITQEYNVNARRVKTDAIDPPFIAARFIFIQNVHDEWILHEMAEEAAIVTPLPAGYNNYEKLYLKYRRNNNIVEHPEHDPVCGLPDGDKLRLCVSMMNTSTVTGSGTDVQFDPRYTNLRVDTQTVEIECVLRRVQFMTREIAKDPSVHEHDELTITCSALNHEKETEVFAVGRGYSLNSIFVFQIIDEDFMVVDHHSHNVSVVDDPVIQVVRSGSKKIVF